MLDNVSHAKALGYHSLTTPLHEVWERDHIASIDKSLSTCDAVWVKIYDYKGKYTDEIEAWRK